MQTTLGLITMGKIGGNESDSFILILSFYANNDKITELWNLNTLDIVDPMEEQSN